MMELFKCKAGRQCSIECFDNVLNEIISLEGYVPLINLPITRVKESNVMCLINGPVLMVTLKSHCK